MNSNEQGLNGSPATSSEDELQKLAKRRVEQKMGFYTHAMVYVLVNLGLYVLTNAGSDWSWGNGRFVIVPMVPWGIGLAIHCIVTFVSLQGGDLRQHLMDKELETLRRRQQR